MTQRERLLAALRGEPLDRVPIWLLFPYHPLGCYVDVRQHAAYRPVYEASKADAMMLNRRGGGPPLFASEVVRTSHRDSAGRQVSTLAYKGRTLESSSSPDGNVPFLKCQEDLEFYCSLPMISPRELAVWKQEATERIQRDVADFPVDYGATMLDCGEPIGPIYANSDLAEFSMWSVLCPDLVKGFLDKRFAVLRESYAHLLRHTDAEVFFLVGSELAAPPLVGVDTFNNWIVPYAKELIAMIHDHGKFAIQHFHGQIKELLPGFVEMRPDALHTIEAPPIGNCTFAEAFEAVGDSMALIGNVQYDDFRAFTPQQMEEAVCGIIEECRGKRLILSPTAGPFDPDPPQRLIDNYLAFMQAGRKYGRLG